MGKDLAPSSDWAIPDLPSRGRVKATFGKVPWEIERLPFRAPLNEIFRASVNKWMICSLFWLLNRKEASSPGGHNVALFPIVIIHCVPWPRGHRAAEKYRVQTLIYQRWRNPSAWSNTDQKAKVKNDLEKSCSGKNPITTTSFSR